MTSNLLLIVFSGSFEPPLTNVFTMQWFLTLFCTCLPINCVLRVWDLVLIEGSDVLLRTALAIWGLLEEYDELYFYAVTVRFLNL